LKNTKQITAAQVARLAGVSISAVSRTFTEGASVSPEMKEKVLEAADKLGYQVNFLARSFHKQKMPLIGVVVSDLDTPFRSRLLADLIQVIQSSGLNTMVCETGKGQKERDVFIQFLQFRVSGVVILSGMPSEIIVNICAEKGIPTVAINRQCSLDVVDEVMCDNFEGGIKASNLLISAGCKNLVYVTQEDSSFSGTARGTAFIKSFADKVVSGQVQFRNCTVPKDDMASAIEMGQKLFATQFHPDGIFAANDLLACGIIEGARAHHNRLAGRDFSIIGFDDIDCAGWPGFGLSTFKQDTFALASQAMTRLQERIADPTKAKTTDIIPIRFIQRSSITATG
jgi:DNA-binding LacI/PurR family transcriptional regulator